MRCFLLIFFLILSGKTSSSNEFTQTPLSEYIENSSQDEESLTENLIYESTRCSALFAWIASISANLNSEKAKKLEKKSLYNAKSLSGVALQTYLSKTENPSDLSDVNLKINDLIEKKIMNYQSDGHTIKNLEGSYIKDYIKDDLKICNIMIEAYKVTY
tara:strand:- start:10 stop:486 length:477 start_codon:yes stop_codon:yes gene_type:complete